MEIVLVSVLMKVAQHITVVGEGGQLSIEGKVGKTHDLLWKIGSTCTVLEKLMIISKSTETDRSELYFWRGGALQEFRKYK